MSKKAGALLKLTSTPSAAPWSNLMTNPLRVLIWVVVLITAAWVIWVNVHTIIECRTAGGTVVQGLFLLECIR